MSSGHLIVYIPKTSTASDEKKAQVRAQVSELKYDIARFLRLTAKQPDKQCFMILPQDPAYDAVRAAGSIAPTQTTLPIRLDNMLKLLTNLSHFVGRPMDQAVKLVTERAAKERTIILFAKPNFFVVWEDLSDCHVIWV